MGQIFHSWCMGSNLGNLEAGSPENGDRVGRAESRKKKNCTASCWRGLDLSKIYMAAVLMIKVCPEVRVCGFGSSPRFGDELMEIGVAAGRSVALGKCGLGVWYWGR